jgi:cytochrome c556
MAGIDEGWAALAFDLEGSRPSSETATQAAELVDMLRSAFDADARMEEGAFHGHAMQSISHATALEHALRGDRFDQVNDLVDALNATCMSCHRQYRD